MVSSEILRRVALVRTDLSEEPGASFIRVTRIGELGTTQAATSNRRTLRIVLILFLRSVRRFLHEPHGVTSQKTQFFMFVFCPYILFRMHVLLSSRHDHTSECNWTRILKMHSQFNTKITKRIRRENRRHHDRIKYIWSSYIRVK
jgi:hypothetical protein